MSSRRCFSRQRRGLSLNDLESRLENCATNSIFSFVRSFPSLGREEQKRNSSSTVQQSIPREDNSKNTREDNRNRNNNNDHRNNNNSIKRLPSLREQMRKLSKIVHPDILSTCSKEQRENNMDALAELNGVVDAITKERRLPKGGVKRLKFYFYDRNGRSGLRKRSNDDDGDDRNEEDDDEETNEIVKEAKFLLKTSGGDCRNVLKESLRALFKQLAIEPVEFTWEATDWNNLGTEEDIERERFYEEQKRQTGEYERMVSKQDLREMSEKEIKREQRRNDKLKEDLTQMDFLFEGIAFVPWIPEDEDGRVRRDSMAKEVVPKLRQNGWNLKNETLKDIWRGKRDRVKLLEGLDGASAAAVHAILRHSEIAEKRLGLPLMKNTESFEWLDLKKN